MTQAERVQRAIKESRVSPGLIADACGVSRANVSLWVNGQLKSSLKAENVFRLADVTGFSARWIATGEGREKSDEAPPVPPLLARLHQSLLTAHKEGRLTRQLAAAIDAMIGAASPQATSASSTTGSRLSSRSVSEDLDILQAIYENQATIRDELHQVVKTLRTASPAAKQQKANH